MRSPNKSLMTAIIILSLVSVWVLSSYIFKSDNNEDSAGLISKSETDLQSILKIERRFAQVHQGYVVLYGETEPNRKVNLKAETQGAVENILAKEGQILKKGDVIVKIDERDRRAQYAQAKALLNQRTIEYEAARKLKKQGFQTAIRLAEKRTNLEEARVNLRRIDIELKQTQLRAPFDGTLEKINVEVGDFVGVGVFGGEGALATVVDRSPLLITGQVSEKDWKHIKAGAKAKGQLANGDELEGTIKYVASVAEPESRTFRVEVEVMNENLSIPAGITAELYLPSTKSEAYVISPSILSLDTAGNVGVKILDENNTVIFNRVEIIEEGPEGMWVSGLPSEVMMITVGQAFVSVGQSLDAAVVAKALGEKDGAVSKTHPNSG